MPHELVDTTNDDDPTPARLVQLAQRVLPLLHPYPGPLGVATDAVERARRHLASEPAPAALLGEYLNHPDPDLDLSAQYSYVDDNEHALAALDVVSLAVGAVARSAYMREGLTPPEPVLLATPDVVPEAFTIYGRLVAQGLVER